MTTLPTWWHRCGQRSEHIRSEHNYCELELPVDGPSKEWQCYIPKPQGYVAPSVSRWSLHPVWYPSRIESLWPNAQQSNDTMPIFCQVGQGMVQSPAVAWSKFRELWIDDVGWGFDCGLGVGFDWVCSEHQFVISRTKSLISRCRTGCQLCVIIRRFNSSSARLRSRCIRMRRSGE